MRNNNSYPYDFIPDRTRYRDPQGRTGSRVPANQADGANRSARARTAADTLPGSVTTGSRRGWVKNAIIVFLAVMLVLTFFSNTIMNYSLPEVAAQYPLSTTVTTKVRGTGTVEAAQSYSVTIAESRTVSSVSVKAGDTIEAGELLLTLDATESTELQQARAGYDALLLEYNKMLLGSASTENAANETITQAQQAVTNAESALAEAKTYESGLSGYQQAESDALKNLSSAQNWEAEAQAAVASLQSQIENAANSNADYLAAVNTYGAESPEAMEIYNAQIAPAIASLTQQLTTAQGNLANAQASVTSAQNSYASAQSATQNYQSQHSGTPGVDAAQEALTAARNNLASLQAAAADTAAQAQYDASVTELELAAKKAAVDQAAAQVAALEEKTAASEVVSRSPGVVTEVNVSAGDITAPDSPLIVIERTDLGYTLKTSVTKEQARLLSAGMTAEITNLWNTDAVMTLTGITADTSNPNSGRVLTFSLSGEDISVGQSISFSIGDKNATYDVVIPTSAVHTDADGSFVYTVTVKSSPLGNRYRVKKLNVTVIAADDSQSAVTGELSTADFVITTSTVPLEPGDQVRIAE